MEEVDYPEPRRGGGDATLQESSAPEVEDPFDKRLYHLYCEKASPAWPEKMATLIQEQATRSDSIPPLTLAVAYNPLMNRHGDGSVFESPDRCQEIWEHLSAAGILDEATKLEERRMASKEQILSVHEESLFEDVEKLTKKAERLEKEEFEEERKEFEENLYKAKTLLVNRHSMECAQLASGSVLTCIDHVMEKGGAAMSLQRPPGRRFFSFLKAQILKYSRLISVTTIQYSNAFRK